MFRRLGLVSAILFLLSAALGVWVAYDRPTAWIKFLLIALTISFYCWLAWFWKGESPKLLKLAGLISTLTAGVLGLVFASVPHLPSGPVANGMAILLPLAIGNLACTWNLRQRQVTLLSFACIAIGLIGLILTRERSAWLALGAGVSGTYLIRWLNGLMKRTIRWSGKTIFRIVILVLIASSAVVVVYSRAVFIPYIKLSPLVSRFPLWHDSLALIQDYLFTGSGLGNASMVFSSYVYLLHVPFQDQAHNLFLQIMIEQGLVGIVSFLGMGVAAIASLWTQLGTEKRARNFTVASTLAALLTLLVYALIDSEIYVSGLVPILFLPFIFAGLLGKRKIPRSLDMKANSSLQRHKGTVWVIPSLLFLWGTMVWLHPKAQILANLGAVDQAKAELSIFRWPKWGLQDQVRRSNSVDLSKAIEYYRQALLVDPTNPTANRRLGQIELSRGDLESARHHLELAYLYSPEQRATRQLLGEVYAVEGDTRRAVKLWQGIDFSRGQLDVRLWWYQSLHAQVEVDRLVHAISLFNTLYKDVSCVLRHQFEDHAAVDRYLDAA